MATGSDESGAQQAHKTGRSCDSIPAKGFTTLNKGCSETEIQYSKQTKHDFKRGIIFNHSD